MYLADVKRGVQQVRVNCVQNTHERSNDRTIISAQSKHLNMPPEHLWGRTHLHSGKGWTPLRGHLPLPARSFGTPDKESDMPNRVSGLELEKTIKNYIQCTSNVNISYLLLTSISCEKIRVSNNPPGFQSVVFCLHSCGWPTEISQFTCVQRHLGRRPRKTATWRGVAS